MNSQFISGTWAKHIPPACAMNRKTSHILPAVGDENRGYEPIMNRSSKLQKKAKAFAMYIDKRRLVNASKMTCKGNPLGLTFPDNFLAIFGYRRVAA